MDTHALNPPIKKMVIFTPIFSQYKVQHKFTEYLTSALRNEGVHCLVITEEDYKHFHKLGFRIKEEAPDCTLCFNGILPTNNQFLSDEVKIPHIACLIDPAHQFLSLTKSPYTIIAADDEFDVQFYKQSGFDNVFFFPHATRKVEVRPPNSPRSLDLVMLSSFIDFEMIRNTWKTLYSKPIQRCLDLSQEIILSDQKTPYPQALLQAMNDPEIQKTLNPKKANFIQLLFDLESYTKGKHRYDLVLSIKDAQVHIFGDSRYTRGWKDVIPPNLKNMIIHEPVPFENIGDVLKDSKILLHSCRSITHGGHERIFTAMSYGTIVMAGKNEFLEKNFEDGKNILFYDNFFEVNAKVEALLPNTQKREEMAKNAFEKVQKEHTWEERAKTLLKEVPPLIKKIKNAT